MLLDTVLLTFLGWYFDHVIPKAYGARHDSWFCFLPSYWHSAVLDGQDASFDDAAEKDADLQEQLLAHAKNDAIEKPTQALQRQAGEGNCVQ